MRVVPVIVQWSHCSRFHLDPSLYVSVNTLGMLGRDRFVMLTRVFCSGKLGPTSHIFEDIR